jgi:hypothetical protein
MSRVTERTNPSAWDHVVVTVAVSSSETMTKAMRPTVARPATIHPRIR